MPSDRDGSFEPILIPKHERRFTGFDDKIIAMYSRGMSVREIQGFIAESYGTQVSPDFISSITDEVIAEAIARQSRPLEPMYPVVFFDALRVKIRGDGVVSNKRIGVSNRLPCRSLPGSPLNRTAREPAASMLGQHARTDSVPRVRASTWIFALIGCTVGCILTALRLMT